MTADRIPDRSDGTATSPAEGLAVRFQCAAAIQAFPLDDDLVLYDDRDGRSYVLNRTGAAVWRLCDGEATVDDLVASIAREYGEPTERVRPDVEALLAELREAGLLAAGA